jgi:hypothetical protein
MFNLDPSVGSVSAEGENFFYTPLKQGIDWLFYIDDKNFMPCSVPVVVIEKLLTTQTNTSLYAVEVSAYTARYDRSKRFRIDNGFGLANTLNQYSFTRVPSSSPNRDDFIADTSSLPSYFTVSSVGGYSSAHRVATVSLDSRPPYRFKAYLGWMVNVGGLTDAPPIDFAILSGAEFESDDNGVFAIDFTTTLYGLPAGVGGLIIYIVDPVLGDWTTKTLPTLLPPGS